ELEELLGLGAGRSVAIEERAHHAADQVAVLPHVLLRKSLGKRTVSADRRCPWTAAGVGIERFTLLLHMRHDAGEPGAFDEFQMVGEALVRLDAVLRAADRPPEQHAERRRRMRDGEGHDARDAHAAAHDMRALDAQVLEQQLSLPRVMRPGDELDASGRLAALAPVEHDAAEFLRQVIEQLDARVDALRGPLLDDRVESARRVQQERRTAARPMRTRPSRHGPPPRPPITGITTALTTAAPASGPEWRKSSSAAPAPSRRFASSTSSATARPP